MALIEERLGGEAVGGCPKDWGAGTGLLSGKRSLSLPQQCRQERAQKEQSLRDSYCDTSVRGPESKGWPGATLFLAVIHSHTLVLSP